MARKRREIPVVHVKERSNGRFAYFFEGIKVNGKRTQISKGECFLRGSTRRRRNCKS